MLQKGLKKVKMYRAINVRSCNLVFIRLCKLITLFSDLEIYRNGEWVLGPGKVTHLFLRIKSEKYLDEVIVL